MRVFVTGASGFIGSAVVQELQDAGHTVLGLARSDASAQALRKAGADVHRGDVTDVDSLASGARAADGVVHTAFIHDFSQYEENNAIDRRAVTAIAQALAGTDRPFVATSGTSVLTPGHVGTEDEAPDPASPGFLRSASEAALPAAKDAVRTSVVRLPPSVHGSGKAGFVSVLTDIARQAGVSAFVGDGENRWPAVHRLDAARLFRLALEGAAPGAALHGVGEEGVAVRAIAEAIGQGLGVPTTSLSAEEAADHFGFFATFVGLDLPASSALTRAALGWTPTHAGLLADLHAGPYFS